MSPGKFERDLHNEGPIIAPLNACFSLSLCHGERYNSTGVPRYHSYADYATKAPFEDARKRHSAAPLTLRPLTPTATRNSAPTMQRCGGARARLHRGVTAANITVIDASIKQRAAARLRCPCDPGRFKVVFHITPRACSILTPGLAMYPIGYISVARCPGIYNSSRPQLAPQTRF